MEHKVEGTLLIIGGAEDKDGKCEILKRFIDLAGGEKAYVVVLTTATQEPETAGREYYEIFHGLGAGIVEVLDLDSRKKANHLFTERLMEKATGIFFTGGDQLRITAALGGTTADDALKKAYRRGAVIAGTSAGASVMSNTMIVEGDSSQAPKLNTIKMAPGLGLLKEVVIDQHFAQRGRTGRLLSAVAHNPYILGVGIDEDTAILVYPDARLEIIGSQTVTFLEGRHMAFSNVSEHSPGQALAVGNMILHVLPKGFGFDLNTRKPTRFQEEKGENNENHRNQAH
ncbi:MAG: cyanophycinase [Firmicutes bacterium HGW-Firmicutes-14]|nr:MAG: cyanophycinase [Firmicutes bacterium HGW-Firmicutes-14]